MEPILRNLTKILWIVEIFWGVESMWLYCEDYLFFWSAKQKVLQNSNCCPAPAFVCEHDTTFAFSHSRWFQTSDCKFGMKMSEFGSVGYWSHQGPLKKHTLLQAEPPWKLKYVVFQNIGNSFLPLSPQLHECSITPSSLPSSQSNHPAPSQWAEKKGI